ncbi:MAG: DNA recombination protein RmuC, partial [Patescibacteria group bacterium]
LCDTLEQAFSGNNYSMQYKFKEGQVVDAVIRTSAGIIPIDSKFPMDAFQRCVKAETEQISQTAHREFMNAVRKHIRDVGSKYILPQEGTVNFAVMYVPSEAVYYEVMQEHDDLQMYAHENRVMVVSPNTFSHFLQVVMMGIERSKLHEQAQRIWEVLKGVQKETSKFGDRLGVLHRHITNAKNAMDTVTSDYAKLSGTVDQIKLIETYGEKKGDSAD